MEPLGTYNMRYLKQIAKILGKLASILIVLMALAIPATSDEVDDLMGDLNHGTPEVRWEAAKHLGDIGSPRAVDSLLAALRDENYKVRSNAAEALGKIGDPRAVDLLIVALKEDEVKPVRMMTTQALLDMGDLRAVDPLIEALNDVDIDVRMKAAEALGKLNDARAVDPLIQVLTKNLQTRVVANDSEKFARELAAESLGNLRDPRAVDPLIKALNDPWIARTAAEALGKIGDTRAVDPLIKALKPYGSASYEAAISLGEIGDPRATDALKEAANTGQTIHLREAASEALRKLESVDSKSETNQIVPTAQTSSSQQNAVNSIQAKMKEEAIRKVDLALSQQNTTTLIQEPVTEPTKSLTTLNFEVASDVYSEKDRQVLYCPKGNYMVVRNRIYLTGMDIDKVMQVEYLLHPSFSNRVAVSRDPTNDFEAWIWSWGGFPIKATITTKSGQVFEKEFDFSFKTEFEEAQNKGIPQVMRCEE